jgi:hypothetical protein
MTAIDAPLVLDAVRDDVRARRRPPAAAQHFVLVRGRLVQLLRGDPREVAIPTTDVQRHPGVLRIAVTAADDDSDGDGK